jgi:signal transduction histidine kinase
MTFRVKLILWYSSLLMAIIMLFGITVYSLMDRTLVETVDSALSETASLVTNSSRVRLVGEFGAPDQRTFVLPRLDLFRASGVEVQVWSLDQAEPRLEAASNNIREYDMPLDPAALGTAEPVYTNVNINGRAMRVLTSPMFARGELLANVQAVALLDAVNDARERLLLVMSVAGLLAVVGSVLVGALLARRVLKPITDITAAAASIARTDDLSTRLPWTGPMDELGRLTSVFNEMMGRLQDLFSVQQRFVADVSHELRTPLTAMRGNLDIMKRYGMDELSLEAIESETERMSRLVNDLLLLARADYGGLTLELEPLDLDTVALEAHRQAQVLVKDRDLMVTLPRFEPVRVLAHGDRMKQLLLNLLSNAIKFTPDGGRISLSVYADGADAVIQVADTGIGIAPEDHKRIFERFWQADSSRVRGAENADSSGLGLAIVKWIVEAHHGTIEVESALGQGSTFTVRLPLLTDHPDSDSQQTAGGSPFNRLRSSLRRSLTPER